MTYNFRQDEALETMARNVITQYNPKLLCKTAAIQVDDIMEHVYGLQLEFFRIRKDGSILGETIFEDGFVAVYEPEGNAGYKLIQVKAGTVIIEATLLQKRYYGRFRFTCAHELSHWLTDKQHFLQTGESAALTNKTARDMERKSYSSIDSTAAVERQANRMASRILMPKCTLKQAFYDAGGNRRHDITSHLAELYGVSKQAMQIRLEELGLVSSPHSQSVFLP